MKQYLIAVAAALAIAACGPSAAEIKTAKTATYRIEPSQLVQLAQEAAQGEGYKITEVDGPNNRFLTVPRWYTPEGGLESPGAGDYVQLQDRSVQVGFLVEIFEGEGTSAVRVTPQTMQYLSGSPKPRELAADDPNLPPFVHGRADSLQLAIYHHAQAYVAK